MAVVVMMHAVIDLGDQALCEQQDSREQACRSQVHVRRKYATATAEGEDICVIRSPPAQLQSTTADFAQLHTCFVLVKGTCRYIRNVHTYIR